MPDPPELETLVAQYVRTARHVARADASLELLLARCRPLVERIVRRQVRGEADVADVVQDSLIQVARHVGHLREPSAFPHWLARVVQNACRQHLRRARLRWREQSLDRRGRPPPGAVGGRALLEVPDPEAARDALAHEDRDRLESLMATLPAEQRTALALAYLDERSHEQVGRELGVGPRAVEGLVYRALGRLRVVSSLCGDGAEPLRAWCMLCGGSQLEGYLRPVGRPDLPLQTRVTCPRCLPGYFDMISIPLPLRRYESVDDALQAGQAALGPRLLALAGHRDPPCGTCGGPMRQERSWETLDRAGRRPYAKLRWTCRACGAGTTFGGAGVAAASPAWLALARAPTRLVLERQRLVRTGGRETLVTEAADVATGRRVALHQDWETLRPRRAAGPGGLAGAKKGGS